MSVVQLLESGPVQSPVKRIELASRHLESARYKSGALEAHSQSTRLSVLGLDEVALKKGHKNYVTLVTARLWDGRIAILGALVGVASVTVEEGMLDGDLKCLAHRPPNFDSLLG